MAKLFDEKGRPIMGGWAYGCDHNLVGGALTEDGVQWSTAVPTVAANEDKIVFSKVLESSMVGKIFNLEASLDIQIKAGSVTADVKYKWQARKKGGTWVDLHDYITITTIGTDYVAKGVAGVILAGTTDLDEYPIEIQLVIQSNETTPGVATAQVKNTSYIYVELI